MQGKETAAVSQRRDLWCHKADIAVVAGSHGLLFSQANPQSTSGGRGPVLSVQSSGSHSFAKPQEDGVGPREYEECGLMA